MNKLNKLKMEKNNISKIKVDSKNKLVLWEGFKKEIPWILFWLLIGVMAYGYYQDKKICEEVLADPCDICYKLNQTLISSDYLLDDKAMVFSNDINIVYTNISLNESIIIPPEDKNPNARTVSNYK